MKKLFKTSLSVLLAVLLLLSAMSAGLGALQASAAGKRAGALAQGENFYMGRWPQSRVSDSSLLSSLNALSVKLWSYEYKYNASTSSYSVLDMSFGDVAYGGEVYRKVVINQYRPYYTGKSSSSSSDNSFQDDNGYSSGNAYWFRWDPIRWKTLKAESDGVYVMSDLLLDSQPYNDIDKSITWEESTIRAWLSQNFYQSAFSANEKGKILSYYHQNENSPWDSSVSGGAATTDKIWVLSHSDAINSAYGFSSSYSSYDTARCAQGSDYAKSQGLWVIPSSSYRGNYWWWLRSPCDYSNFATSVSHDGYACNYSDVGSTWLGVRPAFKINPSSILSGSADPAEVGRIFHGSISGTPASGKGSKGTDFGMINFTVYNGTEFLSGSADFKSKISGDVNFMFSNVTSLCGGVSDNFNYYKSAAKTDLDAGGITFKKSGFRDYIIPAAAAKTWKSTYADVNSATANQDVFMLPDSKDGRPYISTVFAKKSGKDTAFAEIQANSLDVNEGAKYDLILTSPASNIKNFTIAQDDAHKITSASGVFASEDLYGKLKANVKTYAYVTDTAGKTSQAVEIKIKKQVLDKGASYLLSASKISLLGEDGTSLTVPDSIPFVGGSKIDMGFANFPIGVNVENDLVKVSIGLSFPFGSSGFDWDAFKKQCSTCADSIKDSKDALKKFRTFKKTFAPGQSYNDKSNKFNADVMGYLEGKIANGKLVITSFGGSLAVGFSYSYTQQASIGPVPVYFYVKAAIEASLQISKARPLADSSVPLDLGVILDVAPSLQIGGGAGVKGAVSAGIWGKGTFDFYNNFSSKYREVSLKGEFGVEGEFFIFSGSKTLLDGTLNIYKGYYGDSKVSAAFLNPLGEYLRQSRLALSDRSYAENTSAWLGNIAGEKSAGSMRSAAVADADMQEQTLQSSVYKNSQPQIVCFGNKALMVYVEDCSERDTYNRYRLVYSVYDGNAWSVPQAVDDTGTMDAAPSLASDGEHVYLAWQNIKSRVTENDFTQVSNNAEIKFATFNTQSDCFENVQVLTDNNRYDYAPCVTVNSGEPVVYFATCVAADLHAEGVNTVYRYAGGEVTAVKASLNFITDLKAQGSSLSFVENGNNHYVTDENDYTANITDNRLYLNGEQVVLAEETAFVNSIAFDENETLYYADGANLYTMQSGEAIPAFESTIPVQGNLNVCLLGGKPCAVWTCATETGNELYYSERNGENWNEPIALTDYGASLNHVIAVPFAGRMQLVYNKTARVPQGEGEERYYTNGATDLCTMTIGDFSDIAISVDYVDESAFEGGQNVQIPVMLENRGTQAIENVSFSITDGSGAAQVTELSVALQPGESKQVEANYTLPEVVQADTLTIEAVLADDNDSSNNVCEYRIGNADLAVSEITVEKTGNVYVLSAFVANQNAVDAANVQVEFSMADATGSVRAINTIGLDTVGAEESRVVTFMVHEDDVHFDENDACQIVINATTTTGEYVLGNNTVNSAIADYHYHKMAAGSVLTQNKAKLYGCACEGCDYSESKPIDLNGDKVIDIADISFALAKFGEVDTTCDLNSSGAVDIADISIMLLSNVYGYAEK